MSAPNARRIAVSLLVLAAALAGAGGANAQDRAALRAAAGTRVFLTGPSKITVGKLARATTRLSFRFDFGETDFTASVLHGRKLAGTYVSKGRKHTCTFDEAALAELATEFAAAISANLEGNPPVAVRIDGGTSKVTLGATRPSRRFASTLKLAVSVDGGEEVAGVVKTKGTAVPRRVLVLNDGEAAEQVAAALLTAGHVPIDGGNYWEWDGSPSLDEAECVFFLQGENYSDRLLDPSDAALTAWVQGGGGLLRTEWAAYENELTPRQAIDVLMPVVAPESDYGYGSEWAVTNRRHPLAKGLPKRFAIADAGVSYVGTVEGATVVATATRDGAAYPALTYATFGEGTVLHVNHDLTYTVDELPPQVLRILVNAAAFLAP